MAVAGREFFRDHHPYDKRELEKIFKNARDTSVKLVLTTAKDFSRMKMTWQKDFQGRAGIPQLGIVDIAAEPDPSFWKFLKARVSGQTESSDRQ